MRNVGFSLIIENGEVQIENGQSRFQELTIPHWYQKHIFLIIFGYKSCYFYESFKLRIFRFWTFFQVWLIFITYFKQMSQKTLYACLKNHPLQSSSCPRGGSCYLHLDHILLHVGHSRVVHHSGFKICQHLYLYSCFKGPFRQELLLFTHR